MNKHIFEILVWSRSEHQQFIVLSQPGLCSSCIVTFSVFLYCITVLLCTIVLVPSEYQLCLGATCLEVRRCTTAAGESSRRHTWMQHSWVAQGVDWTLWFWVDHKNEPDGSIWPLILHTDRSRSKVHQTMLACVQSSKVAEAQAWRYFLERLLKCWICFAFGRLWVEGCAMRQNEQE